MKKLAPTKDFAIKEFTVPTPENHKALCGISDEIFFDMVISKYVKVHPEWAWLLGDKAKKHSV